MGRKMRKTVVLLIAVVVFSVLALPYGFGVLTEKAYTRAVERLARSNGLRLSDRHYHRGWLGATATMTLMQPGLPFQLRLTHRIAHGPFPFAARLDGQPFWLPVGARVRTEVAILAPPTSETNSATAQPILTAETLGTLKGEAESHITVQPGQAPRGTHWGPGAGTAQYSTDGSRFAIDLRLSDAELHIDPLAEIGNEHLTIDGAHVSAKFTESAEGVLLGKMQLTLGKLAAPALATLQHLTVDLQSSARNGLLDLSATPEIGEIRVGDRPMGTLRFTMHLKRVSLAHLARFDDAVEGLSSANAGAEELSLRALGQLAKLLSGLSKTAPELEIRDFRFHAAAGEVRGHAKLTLDGRSLDTQRNPMLLLVALRADAELDVARPLMRAYFADRILRSSAQLKTDVPSAAGDTDTSNSERTAQIIDEALPTYMAKDELGRYFHLEGDRFQAKVSVRRGQVMINDRLWSGTGTVTP